MNKRDYFAAQAMQALIAKMPLLTTEDMSEEDIHNVYIMITNSAYIYAEHMLEARKEWN